MGPYPKFRSTTVFVMLLLAGLVVFPAVSVRALEISDLEGKIAFLRDGDVWIADLDGRKARQVTNTNGNIKEGYSPFFFSPTLRYLAYSKFLRYALELDEAKSEQVPGQAVHSIVITDLTNQKPVTEIRRGTASSCCRMAGFRTTSSSSMRRPAVAWGTISSTT